MTNWVRVSKLRDGLLDRDVFHALLEVQALAERYHQIGNPNRPHSSLAYRLTAPAATLPENPSPVLVGLAWRAAQP